MEPATITLLFDKTLAAIGLIRDGKRRRDEKTDQALLALYVALAETRAYVTARARGTRRSRTKETSLAKLWHNAAVPLRHIDPNLANRCFLKGSYWLEPDIWSKPKINESGIALDRVFEAARALLVR